MRLIDADALGSRMYHESFEKDSDLQRWDGGCWIRYKLFEQTLREMPTIQPEMSDLIDNHQCKVSGDRPRRMERHRHRTDPRRHAPALPTVH